MVNSRASAGETLPFVGVDIYLIDQILKNRFPRGACILDAGCGGGRNLSWFLQNGYNVYGVDDSAEAIAHMRYHAGALAPDLAPENFRAEPVEHMSFDEATFDAVLSIAVLHFARDEAHFYSMLQEMWRVLRPRGLLFARLASDIGIEPLVQHLGNRRFAIPDGSTRFLVNLEMLLDLSATMKATVLEPIKTVNVQNMRCMTTWVLRK